MCGIAVSVDLSGRGRAEPWALERIRHRGPDGSGQVRAPDGSVALEHCRLAIIDPANAEADQPFSDQSGRWTIVFNGEIFNYRDLRAALQRQGVGFRTNSDTEVILLGFIAEGEAIVERLRGMFAFVIWDSVTGDVFAARDHIGVKPLYYFVRDGMLVLCSEVRPLLAHPRLDPTVDPAGVVEYLAFGNNLGERTVVEDIRKLPPGHTIAVREGRLTLREYWDVLPGAADGPGDDAAAELGALLDDAVAASLVSDVPLGLMLSGGIDSSAVAALAVRHTSPSALTAYSVAFGRPDDEVQAAARLARDLGLRHRVVTVSEEEVRDEFEHWLAGLDYPSANPTWIASWFIARAAREDGIKVLLSGDGGDELFGGYTRWMKYLRFHDRVWSRAPGAARRLAGHAARPGLSGLARDIARRAASGGDLFVPSRPFHDDLLWGCLGESGRAAAAAEPPEGALEGLRRRFDERLPEGDYLAWMSYVTLRTKLVEDFLGRLDKMGMQHSVEGRVPLLDHELARWAVPLPQARKVPSGRQKGLLRDAVEPLLPDYVMNHPKQGFCAPVVSWAEELLASRDGLGAGPLLHSGVLRADALKCAARSDEPFAAWTLGVLCDWSNRNLSSAGANRPQALTT